jgi:L-fuculose-phosphate aldolase
MKSESEIKYEIVHSGHRLYEKGFVAANNGNISVRLDSGLFLVTPSGICKGDLRLQDILKVDRNGLCIEGNLKPTTELKMHLEIYRVRPDISSVVHAHPVYSTAFAAARIPLDQCILPEMITTIGAVPLAPFALPSTDAMADSIAPIFEKTDAALLASHGVVTAGNSVWSAYYKMERIEHYAQILFISKYLGGPRALDKQTVTHLDTLREKYGTDDDHHLDCKNCEDDCVGFTCCNFNTAKNFPEIKPSIISSSPVTNPDRNDYLSVMISGIISDLNK